MPQDSLSYYNAWKVCLSVCLSCLSGIFCVAESQTLTVMFESLDLRYVCPYLAPTDSLKMGEFELSSNGVNPQWTGPFSSMLKQQQIAEHQLHQLPIQQSNWHIKCTNRSLAMIQHTYPMILASFGHMPTEHA